MGAVTFTGPGSWTPADVAGHLAAGVPPTLLRQVLARWPHPSDFERSAASDPAAHASAGWPAPAPPLRDLPDGAWLTLIGTPGYPVRLQGVPDQPLVLFGHGNRDALTAACLAIVGGAVSAYGQAVVDTCVAALEPTWGVVAALEPGVPAAALRAAIGSGRPAVAVTDTPTPALTGGAAQLARAVIAAGGAVVSQAGFSGTPCGGAPGRHRTVAGIGAAAVLAEGTGNDPAMASVWEAIGAARPVLVARPRAGHRSAPGAQAPMAMAWATQRTPAQLAAMGAPAHILPTAARLQPLAAGVADDRESLAAMVIAATGLAARA